MFKRLLCVSLSLLTAYSCAENTDEKGNKVVQVGQLYACSVADTVIMIGHGDITQARVQTIVNAANPQLRGGSGVCGAIFAAAGKEELQRVCYDYPTDENGMRCPYGQARITDSFKLKQTGIEYIIHAVGPDCRVIKDVGLQDHLLAQAYTNALILADQHNSTSIAFPFISAGVYGFPKERACALALQTVVKHIQQHGTKQLVIFFVLFLEEDFELFRTTLKKMQSQQ